MITIRTSHQSQTQKSIYECIALGSTQSVLPCMTNDDINFVVRGQRRGHIKEIRCQLTRVTSPSSAAAGSSTLVLAPTPSRPNGIPEFVHQQVTGMI